MNSMASQITSLTLFTQPFIQAQMKENMKAPRLWPLWGEFTGGEKVTLGHIYVYRRKQAWAADLDF